MAERDQLPYRPCAGVMLLNRDGLAFIGRRVGGPENAPRSHEWQMPQGGIDEGEDPYEAALRELYEETSVSSVSLLAEAPAWFTYDIPDEIAGKGWTRKYRGQTQKWFAFRFTGEESEIDIAHPGGGKHKPEFQMWRWERVDRLPALIVPFKRPVYEKVVAAFSHLVPS
jgi:putative (di)nucleoside polyphosphate hydrolase